MRVSIDKMFMNCIGGTTYEQVKYLGARYAGAMLH